METLFQEAQERVVVVSELSSLAARIICAYWNRYTSEQLDSISYDMKLLKQIIEDVSIIKQGCSVRKVPSIKPRSLQTQLTFASLPTLRKFFDDSHHWFASVKQCLGSKGPLEEAERLLEMGRKIGVTSRAEVDCIEKE